MYIHTCTTNTHNIESGNAQNLFIAARELLLVLVMGLGDFAWNELIVLTKLLNLLLDRPDLS